MKMETLKPEKFKLNSGPLPCLLCHIGVAL